MKIRLQPIVVVSSRQTLRWIGLALILIGGNAANIFGADSAAPEQVPWIEARASRARRVAPSADEAPGLQRPPPAGTPHVRPDDATLARLQLELANLKARLAELPKDEYGLPPADAAIYAETVELQLKIDDWPPIGLDRASFTALKWGRAVTAGIKADPDFMKTVRHLAPVGYRSSVDRTAQPYMLLLPDDFDPNAAKPWRLIVTLHGYYRWAHPLGTILGAVNRTGDVHPGAITVLPFGRANNGYTWAGETDVWDVIADVKKRYRIDDNQIVLSGFSMGGGGTVTLGLTRPGALAAAAALGPAVFGFDPLPTANDLPAGPQRWAPLSDDEIEKRVRRIYAAVGLAENGRGLPWMLGCGGDDALMKSFDGITQALGAAKVKYSSYVLAGVGHRGDILAAHPHYEPYLMAHTRDPAPRDVSFATTSLKSASRAWVTIEGLTAHYTKSVIRAVADPDKGALTVTTDGIERFTLTPPESLAPRNRTTVTVDEQKIADSAAGIALTFERSGGRWRTAAGPLPALAKRPDLQGPVGDAFTRGFLCVRPTGTAWHGAVNAHALALLDGVRTLWRTRQFGELPVKDDRDVTADDRSRYDLILFGDPGSNRLIAEVLATQSPWTVPLAWSRDTVGFGANRFSAASHLPALIYPSPLQTGRYVVINGVPMTRAPARDGRSRPDDAVPAILPATVGDFAVLRIDLAKAGQVAGKSVHGGFFDEQWR